MKITFYGYNAFLLQSKLKIAIDPGIHLTRKISLVPESCWGKVDLILVTHGDADHFAFVKTISEKHDVPIVCHPFLVPWLKECQIIKVEPGQKATYQHVEVHGIEAVHGPRWAANIRVRVPRLAKYHRTGRGAIAFKIVMEGKQIVNLGDTLALDWSIKNPDLLMIPIGGFMTMGSDEALAVTKRMRPGIVIPVHYNWPVPRWLKLLIGQHFVDAQEFCTQVEEDSIQCKALNPGESIVI